MKLIYLCSIVNLVFQVPILNAYVVRTITEHIANTIVSPTDLKLKLYLKK